jgi:hypothetical protein
MRIVSHVILTIAQVEKMPERIVEQWAKRMKSEAGRIAEHLKQRIPDGTKFQQVVADAAQSGYANYVSKDYISEGGLSYEEITSHYGTNIKGAYEKYREGLEYVFEEVDGEVGKRFKEKVERAKEHYARGSGKKVFAFAGCKVTGKGCAPIAAAWLTGQQKIMSHLSGDRVLEGGPFLVTTRESAPSLRTTLNQRLIQAGITILNANLAQTVLKLENDRTNSTVQGFVDKKLKLVDFQTGGDSRVDYFIDENGQMYLEIKVSQK